MNQCQTHNLGVKIVAAAHPGSPNSKLLDGSITSIYDTEAATLRTYALRGCNKLTSAAFLELNSIPEYAFTNCSTLSELNVPKVVQIANGNPFNGCTNLKIVNFPSLQQTAFGNGTYFEDVTFGATDLSGVSIQGSVTLKQMSIPNAVTVSATFCAGCTSLESVNAPELQSTIYTSTGSYASFKGCSSLQSINFPKIKTVAQQTFSGCASLMSITLGSTDNAVTGIGSNALSSVPTGCSITIYTSDGNALTSNSPWGWAGNPATDINWQQA